MTRKEAIAKLRASLQRAEQYRDTIAVIEVDEARLIIAALECPAIPPAKPEARTVPPGGAA